MPKAAAKLFRDHKSVHQALKQLHTKGFKAEEIGLLLNTAPSAEKLASLTQGAAKEKASLPQGGDIYAVGPIALALEKAKASNQDIKSALMEALGISPETYDYYEFGVSAGGILVSVHASEDRLPSAMQVLRDAEARVAEEVSVAKRTGFAYASKMTATNPIDAPMSGDFRRY